MLFGLRGRAADGRGGPSQTAFGWSGAPAREVARWRHPAGEGRFIAIRARPTRTELLALGEVLRREYGQHDNIVVMVFDDPAAAREVRRGSKIIGEARFQAALAHQRAMYTKDRARGVHSFTIYQNYPVPHEVIRYPSELMVGSR